MWACTDVGQECVVYLWIVGGCVAREDEGSQLVRWQGGRCFVSSMGQLLLSLCIFENCL